MRDNFMVIASIIILLSTNISVLASGGCTFFWSDVARNSPLLKMENHHQNDPLEEEMYNMLATTPVAFTENRGQIGNDDVRYYIQGGGTWFTEDGVWIELRENVESRGQGSEARGQGDGVLESGKFDHVIIKQEFVGANHVRPEGREKLSWNSNFFYGNDSTKWCTEVPNYAEVYYLNLYDGIDLKYYTHKNGLKYDFIVHPGAAPEQIRVKYKGIDGLEIDQNRNLLIKTQYGDLIDGELFIYQQDSETKNRINGKFVIYDNFEYGFKILDNYETWKELIIDPYIGFNYSTYLGGSGNDIGYGIAVDAPGNAYVTGFTNSTNFPIVLECYDSSLGGDGDIFVVKLNPQGTDLAYSTYIGGVGIEYGLDIKVDQKGNTYLTGNTSSNNFPTTQNVYDRSYNGNQDTVIVKLNALGSKLLYSTFIGGYSIDIGWGIAIDSSGNAFVTGGTYSPDFPTKNAFDLNFNNICDAFILKLNPSASQIVYSTFVGGWDEDIAYDIAIDKSGHAFVAGKTASNNFPENAFPDKGDSSGYDVFIIKLNKTGLTLPYSVVIGGYGDEWGNGIDIDSEGNAYITGQTNSNDFPTTTGAYDTNYYDDDYYDVFILKLNPSGSKFIYSTFLGGDAHDEGYDIAVGPFGKAFITGYTDYADFPLNWFDKGDPSIFLFVLAANGSAHEYSAGFGWYDNDFHTCGYSLALDANGYVYITGQTYTWFFEISEWAFDTTYNGLIDSYVIRFPFESICRISSVSLLEKKAPTSKVYSHLCPYTFKVNVIDTKSLLDLEYVRLNLDPLGSDIQLFWNRSLDEFYIINDPSDIIILESSSKAYNDAWNKWTIDFNVTFNWTYPDEELHDIQAYAASSYLSPSWLNSTKMYEVENDLIFNGSFIVAGEDGRVIPKNGLVRGGEVLNWTGLLTTYEGSPNVYPPKGVYNITVWEEGGNSWSDSPEPCEWFKIETNTPILSDTIGNIHTINITGIPPECDKTNQKLNIRIDGDNVSFSNPKPNNTTWQRDSSVEVGVTVTDHGGGLVNGSKIFYAISNNNGETWSRRLSAPYFFSDITIPAETIATFKDGSNNFIKWQASDSVGNGPTVSEPYRVLVDTKDVEFCDPWPVFTYVFPSQNVLVGINISDYISGIDASTIEYSISVDDGMTWGNWTPVLGGENGDLVSVCINASFPVGIENKIRWRACDLAGNGPARSKEYPVSVFESKIIPVIDLVSPLNGAIIRNSTVDLTWSLQELEFQGITFNVVIDSFYPPITILEKNLNSTNLTLENLWDGLTFYWKIVPLINGVEHEEYSSDIWWFTVDLRVQIFKKTFKVAITGPDFIIIYPGENKSLGLTITNLGNTLDIVKMEIQKGPITDFARFDGISTLRLASNESGTRKLLLAIPDYAQTGIYHINITAYSLNGGARINDTHQITVAIVEPVISEPIKVASEEFNWLWLILLIIIIVIILIVVFIFIRRKGRKQPTTTAEQPPALPQPPSKIEINNKEVPLKPNIVAPPTTEK